MVRPVRLIITTIVPISSVDFHKALSAQFIDNSDALNYLGSFGFLFSFIQFSDHVSFEYIHICSHLLINKSPILSQKALASVFILTPERCAVISGIVLPRCRIFFFDSGQPFLGIDLNHDPARIQALKDEPLSFFSTFISSEVKIYRLLPPPYSLSFFSHSALENLDFLYPYCNYFTPAYKEYLKSKDRVSLIPAQYGTKEYRDNLI
jgi:hypothetical protein